MVFIVEIGIYQVVVEYSEEEVGCLVFDFVLELVCVVQVDIFFDFIVVLVCICELDEDVCLGFLIGFIVNVVIKCGILYCCLIQGSMVQFGWGSCQKCIQVVEISNISVIVELIV